MSEPSTNGTTVGYKAATMYVISEKGLESGPFLYGKPTDSRVFGKYHRGKCFTSGLKYTSEMDAPTKIFPVELGPRRAEKICVINLNDVLCKYKKKFPCDELKGIDKPKVSQDPSCIHIETEAKSIIRFELPDSATLLPEGRIANDDEQRVFLSIRGSKSVRRELHVERKDKFRLEKLQKSVHRSLDKPREGSTFWNEPKRDTLFTVHNRNTKAEDVNRTKMVANSHKKTDRLLGELLILKKIYSSREKSRSERGKCTDDITEMKRERGNRRGMQDSSRKQLGLGVQAKAERPSKTLEKTEIGVTPRLKLPVVATGISSKNPVAFEQKDYDRWSRKNKKISATMSFAEGAKSGKLLLPSIAKKF